MQVGEKNQSKIKIPRALVWLLTASISFPAHAAHEQPTDKLFSMSLQELMRLEITSSTLTSKTLLSVPASVTVFTRDQIREMGTEYLYELINFVPGFQSFRQGADGVQHFHSARGHRTSVKSREVLILVDGVRMIRESDSGEAVPMLSLYNVAKVEFIRGPGSAIYGSNAFLGVINIETVRGHDAFQVAGGEHGRKQFNGVYSLKRGDTELNLALNGFDETGESYPLENINTVPLENTRGKDPRTGTDFQFNARHGDFQLKGMISRREAQDYYVVERAAPDTNHSYHDVSHIYLSRDINWQTNLQSSVEVGYSENAFKLNTEIAGLGVTRTDQHETNLHFIARNAWQYASEDSLEFGLELRDSDMSSVYQTETLGDLAFYPDAERTITGLYLQNQRYYDSGLQMVIGGRFDDYDDVGSSFSPRFSLVFPLSPQHAIKALYGEAFRAPNANELYLVGVTLAGNPDLKPETIKTSELIWISHWGKHSLTVNSHYNVIENSIYSTSTFMNRAEDEAFYGMEMDYGVQLSQQWRLQVNASALRNLPSSDFREADRLASWVLNYHTGRWNFNVNANYAASREIRVGSDPVKLDDYWLLNTKWTYKVTPSASVYLNGRNILDEDYGTPNRLALHTQPMPNRGRELVLGIELGL